MQTAKEVLRPGSQLLWARCDDCLKEHPIELRPGIQDQQLNDWWVKHEGHRVQFLREDPQHVGLLDQIIKDVRGWFRRLGGKDHYRRFAAALPWLNYAPNTNDLAAYAASGALTWTLASLASTAGLLIGRESTVITNTVNLYYDYLFGGFTSTGTTPTSGTTIEVWLHGSLDDTPTYVDANGSALTGVDAAATFSSLGTKGTALSLATVLQVDSNTTARKYPMCPQGVAGIFGAMASPKRWGGFQVHNTGVNLNSTAGNHAWSQTGVYGTS